MRVRKITKTWMLLVGTVVLCLTGCGKETQTADFSGVTSVCELATLKCYYHNVAKAETEASGIFAKWLKTGYKKIWTEYSGIIEYGIDISQVTVQRALAELVESGAILKIGGGRYTKYTWNNE